MSRPVRAHATSARRVRLGRKAGSVASAGPVAGAKRLAGSGPLPGWVTSFGRRRRKRWRLPLTHAADYEKEGEKITSWCPPPPPLPCRQTIGRMRPTPLL